MALADYKGHLYAGTQTVNGVGEAGEGSLGLVWRHEGDTTWRKVTPQPLQTSVVALPVLQGRLYAATAAYDETSGQLYRYACTACDGTDDQWILVGEQTQGGGFRAAVTSEICGQPGAIYLSSLGTGDVWRYTTSHGLQRLETASSMIAVASDGDEITGITGDGLFFRMEPASCLLGIPSAGTTWFVASGQIPPVDRNKPIANAVSAFRGALYAGVGNIHACPPSCLGANCEDGKGGALWRLRPPEAPARVLSWAALNDEGITALANWNNTFLYFGMGMRADQSNQKAGATPAVFRYNGNAADRVGTGTPLVGGGIQTLLVREGALHDHDSNAVLDACELTAPDDGDGDMWRTLTTTVWVSATPTSLTATTIGWAMLAITVSIRTTRTRGYSPNMRWGLLAILPTPGSISIRTAMRTRTTSESSRRASARLHWDPAESTAASRIWTTIRTLIHTMCGSSRTARAVRLFKRTLGAAIAT